MSVSPARHLSANSSAAEFSVVQPPWSCRAAQDLGQKKVLTLPCRPDIFHESLSSLSAVRFLDRNAAITGRASQVRIAPFLHRVLCSRSPTTRQPEAAVGSGLTGP
jgi:hypothetical protein